MLILRRYRNLHLQKVRAREARYLRRMNENLLNKIEEKDAELFTQTSFIIKKNELILSLKNIADDFYAKSAQKSLLPFIQKINALLANNMDTEDDWNMFLIRFEEKHKNFFKKLKMLYPQLTNNDLRLCACLKLGLESKDIASLMNISVRAVENNRYRLRKKLDLKPTQNLNDCFMEID
jgi:DNA-binding NarL/FixJ family response regulator